MKFFFNMKGPSATLSRMCFTCVMLLTVFTTSGLTQTVWTENWEGNWIADWHVEAGTWEVGTPTSGPDSAYNGQNCAATVLAGNYPPNANTRLIRHTPFVVPSADQNPRLRFWHWYGISSGDAGTVQIKVGSGNWQTISETYTSTGSNIWTYPYIDLRAYADSTVQISFSFYSDANGTSVSSGWYVDDLNISPSIVGIEEIFEDDLPLRFQVSQNYPNPFNPSTKIKYQLPKASFVSLIVYDVLGNEVISLVNEEKPPGSYEVEFVFPNLSSGIYFYQLHTRDFVGTKKMVLLR